jgi:hypothetical protein
VEGFDFERRHQDGATTLAFGTADPFRLANQVDISWRQQLEQALVEAEIAHRILNLSILDEPQTIASQTGE